MTAELVALLKEARQELARFTPESRESADLLVRMDSVIEAAEPKVQWKFCAARMGRYSLHTFPHGWPTPTSWSCDVQLDDPTVYRHGFKTEKEAQDAAIALVLDWREE